MAPGGYRQGVLAVPHAWGEVVAFVAQPIHLPIALGAFLMVFFVWRSIRHSS